MNCKDCMYVKHCPNKSNPPKRCAKFTRYEDSGKFKAYDYMMRNNPGVSMPNE